MKMNVQGLARSSSRHPWRVIVAWIIVLLGAGYMSSNYLADSLTTEIDFTNVPESKQAMQLIEQKLTGETQVTEFFIVSSERYTAQDPEFAKYVGALAGDLEDLGPDTVASVTDPFVMMAAAQQAEMPPAEGNTPGQVPAAAAPEAAADAAPVPAAAPQMNVISDDGHHALMPVVMAGTLDDATAHVEDLQQIVHEDNQSADFTVNVFGPASTTEDFKTISEEDLRKGESFGLLIALVVLIVVFAAVVAALLPVIMGIFAIAVATGIVALLGIWFDFSFFVPNMISMMGLAVGIDYSLFIVSRFREERRHGLPKLEALSVTGGTANRAVFFSGMTVVLALLGMMIVPTTIFRGLASGAILVVAVSVAASLTLLPALLALLGDKINWPRLSKRSRVEEGEITGGFWDKITKVVMGHPVTALALAAGFLFALSLPYWSINTGMSGIADAPDAMESKQAFVLLTKHFSGGVSDPTKIVIDGDPTTPEATAGIEALSADIAGDKAFGAEAPLVVNEKGDLGVIDVTLAGDPAGQESIDAIGRLRDDYVPAAFGEGGTVVLVGGNTALMKDFFATTDTYTPWIFAFVLGLSFILLTVVFRSIVVPIKAIIMNLLSVGAAYGLVVAVFQKGWFVDVFSAIGFNFTKVDAIDAWLPLFMFSILFGLSMDYHVFLLSRIREEYDHTHDNAESVAFGLRNTGAIITGAALIMVAVFASFAAGRMVMLQEMGFGLAAAVFIDATVVRSVLVPSTMKLLGDRNWYLPKWLQWIPKVEIEGSSGRQQAREGQMSEASVGSGTEAN